MENIYKFNTINEFNELNDHKTLHPLISVIDFSKAQPRPWKEQQSVKIHYGFYCIILKEVKCGDLKYGRNYYDYQEGTLTFVSPGQVIEIENMDPNYQPKGHGLAFHSDLLHGTSLGKHIQDYNFFSYHSNEALHLSDKERSIVLDCLQKIQYELESTIDKHSKKLIVSNIEMLLNYCIRFYDRQFITRENVNKGILEKFEELLNGYFFSEKPQTTGLPSVAYCADKLNLSANYFGDIIKKETGKTAQEYIQNKIIDVAKNKIFEDERTINEIAFELGFKYPQHFRRFFKQKVGVTPNKYRSVN
jgi:AraC-like DNA-binding protein